MVHPHSIYDTDLHFVIDPITRQISSESGKVVLMQNDHNSERFTFELPRFIEGHDMSLSNEVQIHYINVDGSNKATKNTDIYTADDLQISPDGEETVIFSWLLSRNATTFAGSLSFVVRFVCYADTDIEYQWFTDVFDKIKINKGIYNTDVIADEYDIDIVENWKRDIFASFAKSAVYQSVVTCRDDMIKLSNTMIDMVADVNRMITGTEFFINYETGNLEYISPELDWTINQETGDLEWEVRKNA